MTVTYRTFETWPTLLAHVRACLPVYYQAPMDPRPVRVRVQFLGSRFLTGEYKQIRVFPPSHDCDPFTADAGHLDRFRRLDTV